MACTVHSLALMCYPFMLVTWFGCWVTCLLYSMSSNIFPMSMTSVLSSKPIKWEVEVRLGMNVFQYSLMIGRDISLSISKSNCNETNRKKYRALTASCEPGPAHGFWEFKWVICRTKVIKVESAIFPFITTSFKWNQIKFKHIICILIHADVPLCTFMQWELVVVRGLVYFV